jgi:hypothetical protein
MPLESSNRRMDYRTPIAEVALRWWTIHALELGHLLLAVPAHSRNVLCKRISSCFIRFQFVASISLDLRVIQSAVFAEHLLALSTYAHCVSKLAVGASVIHTAPPPVVLQTRDHLDLYRAPNLCPTGPKKGLSTVSTY